MKRLLLIIVLIFNFQSLTKADDINDFEINGISIGDSILKFYDIYELKSRVHYWPKSKKHAYFVDNNFNFDKYKAIQLTYRTNDPNYTIIGITVGIFYNNDSMKECYNLQTEVITDLRPLFPNTKIVYGEINKHRSDPSGKSTFKNNYFRLNNGDSVQMGCYKFSKKMKNERNWKNNFSIRMYIKEHRDFIKNEAYN